LSNAQTRSTKPMLSGTNRAAHLRRSRVASNRHCGCRAERAAEPGFRHKRASGASFELAYGKSDTGNRLDNLVLRTEARITLMDGALATAVLAGVMLNAVAGMWLADPIAVLVLVVYGGREAIHAWRESAAG
jgi:hypothetical protein